MNTQLYLLFVCSIEERIEEIAKMLAGEDLTEAAVNRQSNFSSVKKEGL